MCFLLCAEETIDDAKNRHVVVGCWQAVGSILPSSESEFSLLRSGSEAEQQIRHRYGQLLRTAAVHRADQTPGSLPAAGQEHKRTKRNRGRGANPVRSHVRGPRKESLCRTFLSRTLLTIPAPRLRYTCFGFDKSHKKHNLNSDPTNILIMFKVKALALATLVQMTSAATEFSVDWGGVEECK